MHLVELASAFSVFPFSVQLSDGAPSNRVENAPVTVRGSKVSGCPRFAGAGVNWFAGPIGIETAKAFGFA